MIRSFRFKIGYYILISRDSANPVFGKIVEVLQVAQNSEIFLLTEIFTGSLLSFHYNARILDSTGQSSLVAIHSLKDYHP